MTPSSLATDASGGTTDGPRTVSETLSKVWWIPLLRGVVLAGLGLLLLVQPLVETASAVVTLFTLYLLADAVVALVQGLSARGQLGRAWWYVQVVVDVVFAGFVFLWPGATALVLYYLVASWAVVLGIIMLVTGVNLMRTREGHWPWVVVSGIVGVLFGLVLVARPPDGQTALGLVVAALGVYAFVVGAVLIVSAFAVRAVAAEIDAALAGSSPMLEAAREQHQREAAAGAERKRERQSAHAAKKPSEE